jgi:hypothetical protein
VTTLTTPRNADELAEMIGDPAQLKKIGESPQTMTDFIVDYAKTQNAKDPSIEQQIKDETQRQFADVLKSGQIDNINRLNLTPGAGVQARSKHYNPKARAPASTRSSGTGPTTSATSGARPTPRARWPRRPASRRCRTASAARFRRTAGS